MPFNEDLLEQLIKFNKTSSPRFTLYIDDAAYDVASTVITNSPIPVNEPTTRGGVYFSGKFAYKMKSVVEDLSVVPLLTKKMLGPNTEFGKLRITTQIESDGKSLDVQIFTNLINSVQTFASVELSMIIVKLDYL